MFAHKKLVLFPMLALAVFAGGVYAQDAQDGGYGPPPGAAPVPAPGPGQGPGPGGDNAHFGWADVLRVDPIYGVTRTAVPQQQCYDQQVVQQSPNNKGIGTVLGAVVGGVLGSTIGHGNGRTATTVVGAVAGGAVGNSVASGGGTTESTQTTCQNVTQVSQQRQIIGYDVEYRYHGDVYMSRLNYDPGERLRIRVNVAPAD